MEPIIIDSATAQVMSDTCVHISRLAGASPGVALLIGCGVALAGRLSQAGYEVPALETLKKLEAEIAALPELVEAAPAAEA
jgi:hypothetical protein